MNVDAEKSSVDDRKGRDCPLEFTYLAGIAMAGFAVEVKASSLYGSLLLTRTHFQIDYKGLRLGTVEKLEWRAL